MMSSNGQIDRGSIPGRVIPKTKKKKVLDAALLNIQHHKVRIKGRVGAVQGKGLCTFLHFGEVANEKEAFGSPPITVANFTIF